MHGVAGLQMHLMHTQGSVDTRMHTHKDARMHVYKGVHKGTHKRTHTQGCTQGCIYKDVYTQGCKDIHKDTHKDVHIRMYKHAQGFTYTMMQGCTTSLVRMRGCTYTRAYTRTPGLH